MDAADCETASTSLPSRMISSFCALDSEMVTPSSILTWRTRFSPRKLLGTRASSQRGAGDKRKRGAAIPDLDRLLVTGDDDVDGEVSVDEAHLVGKAVADALDHVLDLRADRAEAGDVLAAAVPDDELDAVDRLERLLRGGKNADRHVDVLRVLRASDPGRFEEDGWSGAAAASGWRRYRVTRIMRVGVVSKPSTRTLRRQTSERTFWRVPRGPVTVMTRDLTVTVTPSLCAQQRQLDPRRTQKGRRAGGDVRDLELLFLVNLLHLRAVQCERESADRLPGPCTTSHVLVRGAQSPWASRGRAGRVARVVGARSGTRPAPVVVARAPPQLRFRFHRALPATLSVLPPSLPAHARGASGAAGVLRAFPAIWPLSARRPSALAAWVVAGGGVWQSILGEARKLTASKGSGFETGQDSELGGWRAEPLAGNSPLSTPALSSLQRTAVWTAPYQ